MARWQRPSVSLDTRIPAKQLGRQHIKCLRRFLSHVMSIRHCLISLNYVVMILFISPWTRQLVPVWLRLTNFVINSVCHSSEQQMILHAPMCILYTFQSDIIQQTITRIFPVNIKVCETVVFFPHLLDWLKRTFVASLFPHLTVTGVDDAVWPAHRLATRRTYSRAVFFGAGHKQSWNTKSTTFIICFIL